MATILKSIPVVIFMLLIMFVSLKSCIYTGWTPPADYTTYGITGEDGREMKLAFLPERKAVVVYGDPSSKNVELILLKFGGGEKCTHYIGPLYNTSRGAKSPFGIRWCSDGAKPARVTYSIENKYRQGFGDSDLGEIGSKHEKVIYFKDDAVKFAGTWMTQVAEDRDLIGRVLNLIDVADKNK